MSIIVLDKDGNRKKIAGKGLPGKSAYQYAVDGGFTGTEEEFSALLGVKSNPNLLDNWYFADPINQRGQMEYMETGYTIDRWGFTLGSTRKISLTASGIKLIPGSARIFFSQSFENATQFLGKTLTVSILSDAGCFSATVVMSDSLPDQGERIASVSLGSLLFFELWAYPTNQIFLQFNTTTTSEITIIAAKLELGPVQTLAHQDTEGNWILNDPPPNKALELAKCQRYYRRIDRIVGNTIGTTQYIPVYINYPDMRINPAVNVLGEIRNGGDNAIAGLSFVAANFTKNSGSYIKVSSNTTGIVQFLDVELDANI